MVNSQLNIKKVWLIGIICILCGCSNPFQTLNGETTDIEIHKNTKALVYIFLVPDCPFSQYYSIAINQVYSVFHKKGFQFYGIVPGDLYTISEVDSFKNRYAFIPEILFDKKYYLTKSFAVKVVPQVVVVNVKGQILYSGKIDDQAIEPGKKKYQPHVFYLFNALKSIELNKDIETKKTQAVGCFIE